MVAVSSPAFSSVLLWRGAEPLGSAAVAETELEPARAAVAVAAVDVSRFRRVIWKGRSVVMGKRSLTRSELAAAATEIHLNLWNLPPFVRI